MTTLAAIRAQLAQTQQGGDLGPNPIFPFWNMPEGKTATVRFLPDQDKNNTFFWQERNMIKLPFPGIKGVTDSRPVIVPVPCMEMFGGTCPILNEVRPWFKSGDKTLDDLGRKYWKKRSYIFQGLIVGESPLPEDEAPENPIRRFIIGPQIFEIIKQALMEEELESLPTD